MAAINEAYRVLGDPGRRAVYDATLRGTGSAAGSSSAPTVVRSRTAPARPSSTLTAGARTRGS